MEDSGQIETTNTFTTDFIDVVQLTAIEVILPIAYLAFSKEFFSLESGFIFIVFAERFYRSLFPDIFGFMGSQLNIQDGCNPRDLRDKVLVQRLVRRYIDTRPNVSP